MSGVPSSPVVSSFSQPRTGVPVFSAPLPGFPGLPGNDGACAAPQQRLPVHTVRACVYFWSGHPIPPAHQRAQRSAGRIGGGAGRAGRGGEGRSRVKGHGHLLQGLLRGARLVCMCASAYRPPFKYLSPAHLALTRPRWFLVVGCVLWLRGGSCGQILDLQFSQGERCAITA